MIPICRPYLPPKERLSPYLARIDESRYYSNWGPMVREYESRLEEHFNSHVLVTSSGTSALICALVAMNLPKRSFIAVPSFTFVASASAIVMSGHIPFFVDVNEKTWVANVPPNRVEGAMIVSPFGDKIELPNYGIPTIVDAAAAFEHIAPSAIPQIVSTHSTKTFSTAEGGVIICNDRDLIERARIVANHGMSPNREINTIGLNAKMSEYHAAIGLAELDGWNEKKEKWKQVRNWYGGCHVKDLGKDALPVSIKMREKGVDTRLSWYGIHHHSAYKNFPRTSMDVTNRLINETIALPFYVDMTKEEVNYVLISLNDSLK